MNWINIIEINKLNLNIICDLPKSMALRIIGTVESEETLWSLAYAVGIKKWQCKTVETFTRHMNSRLWQR